MKRILLCLMAFSAIISSCTRDHGDMYDPEFVREYYESQWKKQFGEIDPNQTWNVAQGVQANLSIKEDALADYTFNIYTSNPLYDKDAKLMAKTKVTTDAEGYAETSIKFDAPNGLKYFYVMRVEDNGRRAVKAIQTAGGVLNASFGNVNPQGARAMVEGDLESTKMACPYTVEEVNNMIATGNQFSNYSGYINDFANGGVYVITGTEQSEGRFPIWCNNKTILIIANGGVLNLNSSGSIGKLDIIVAADGTLNLISEKCTLNGANWGETVSSRFIVLPGGLVEDKSDVGCSLTVGGNGTQEGAALVYNAGTMKNINSMTFNSSGIFYNAETGIYTGNQITFGNSTDVLTNWGKMEVVCFGNPNNMQGTLNNGCLFRATERVEVLYLNQNANTALECCTIHTNYVTLRENSIIRAEYYDMGYTPVIKYVGKDESTSLITADVLYSTAGQAIVEGKIYLEADNLGGGNTEWVVNQMSPHLMFGLSGVGESDFAIFPAYKGDDLEKSDCTGHGNVPDDYVPPTPENGMEWIVACEDLGSIGDYDFNDIVFSVTYVPGGENDTVVVHALAAGGTIPANVYVNNELIGEIHGLFGFDDTSKMINTLAEDLEDGSIFQGMVKKIIAPNFSISTADMGKIRIDIINGDGNVKTAIAPTQGGAPQMICVPAPWKWPVEYTSIGAAYPKFGLWGAGYNTGIDWYSTDIATGSVFNLE